MRVLPTNDYIPPSDFKNAYVQVCLGGWDSWLVTWGPLSNHPDVVDTD